MENLEINKIHCGDNRELLSQVDSDSVQLHITSPPYAQAKEYINFGGISAEHYVDWFLPRIVEIQRTLRPNGVFVLNIDDTVTNGFRNTYVFELIYRIAKETDLKLYERLIWNKGKSLCHPKRFRNPLEYLFIFAKNKDFFMDINKMRLPYSEVSLNRMKNPIKKRFARTVDNQNAGEYKEWSPNPLGALPSTLLNIGSESKRVSDIHVAVFPEKLVEYFMKGFTREGDLVCDIFMGSGTVGCVAKRLNRNFIGMELSQEYANEATNRINRYEHKNY